MAATNQNRATPGLTSEQWSLARLYWRAGFDTLDIAEMFDVPEHEIYNGLSKRRELNRK